MFSAKTVAVAGPNRLSSLRRRIETDPLTEFVDLTASNPTRVGLPWDPRLDDCFRTSTSSQYEPEALGLPAARDALASYLGTRPGRIALTSSTSEAISFIMRLCCNPGEAVACPRPGYPLLEHLARLCDLHLVYYDYHYDGDWFVDPTSLRAAAQSASLLFATSPNNPTGSYLSLEELKLLCSFDKPLVVDEVFHSYPLDTSRVPRARDATGTMIFSLGGLSKELGLPQFKLSWIEIIGSDANTAHALAGLEFIADTFLSVSTPVMTALPSLLDRGQSRQKLIRQRVQENLSVLREGLKDAPGTVRFVGGGWYAVIQLPSTRNDEDWCVQLLETHHVWVHPGYFYDAPITALGGSEALVVVSLLCDPIAFSEGVRRIRKLLRVG